MNKSQSDMPVIETAHMTPRAPRPRKKHRRISKVGIFFTLFGAVAFFVFIAKFALIPLLVWVQTLMGGVV